MASSVTSTARSFLSQALETARTFIQRTDILPTIVKSALTCHRFAVTSTSKVIIGFDTMVCGLNSAATTFARFNDSVRSFVDRQYEINEQLQKDEWNNPKIRGLVDGVAAKLQSFLDVDQAGVGHLFHGLRAPQSLALFPRIPVFPPTCIRV